MHSPTQNPEKAAGTASYPINAWNVVLSRAARPAPWWIWVGILLVTYYIAGILVNPVSALVTVAGIVTALGLLHLLRHPIRGLEFCLIVFPFYTFARGVLMYFRVPAPLELLGMWTEVILTVMAASLVLSCIRQGKRLRVTWYDGPILLMMGSVVYGLILTLSEHAWVAAMYGAHMSLFGMVFYWVTRWMPLEVKQVRRLVVIWLSSFALMALLSLVDYFFRFNFMIEVAIQVRDGFWKTFEPHEFFRWYPRMQSMLFAEQLFGSMCTYAAVYCLCRWHTRPRSRWLPPLLALMMICLGLSMSRGAFVCFLGAAGTLLLLRGPHRRMVGLCLSLIVVAGAVLVFTENQTAQTLVKRVSSVTDSSNQLAYDRANQWQLALDAFPLFPAGLGVGRAGVSALFHGTGSETGVSVVDGGIFKIIAEQGLPGLILFLAGSVAYVLTYVPLRETLLRRAARGDIWSIEGAPLAGTALALMVGLQLQNIGGNVFDAYYLQPVFWILTGLFIRCYEYSTLQQVEARQATLKSRLDALLQGSSHRALPGVQPGVQP